MSLLNKLERTFGRLAVPNLSLWLVAGQVTCWCLAQPFVANFNLARLELLPAAVLAGEWWRLFAFVFLPPNAHPVFLAFVWYLFYLMGDALESFWGTFRYNAFLWLGWTLTVGAAFVTPGAYARNEFLAGSVFLAFAFLNPDFEMMLFFILPVKIKWLALLQWAGYVFAAVVGGWPTRLMVLAAVGNFLVFFGRDLVQLARTGRRRMVHQAKQFGARDDTPEPRHRCRICGKTDLTHPQLDFRYCSKCADDSCYCPEHIRSHEHVVAAPSKP
jgi:hypothetical protein